jgi:hypothetical protein
MTPWVTTKNKNVGHVINVTAMSGVTANVTLVA